MKWQEYSHYSIIKFLGYSQKCKTMIAIKKKKKKDGDKISLSTSNIIPVAITTLLNFLFITSDQISIN